jgi:chaperonin GroEL (HSP60 family)
MSFSLPKRTAVYEEGVFDSWASGVVSHLEESYGPGGGYSLVRADEDWDIVADGTSRLERSPLENPMVTMWTSMMEGQRDAHGDGATLSGLFGALLVEEGIDLVNSGLSPETVRVGFTNAHSVALSALESATISPADARQRSLVTAATGNGILHDAVTDELSRVVRHHQPVQPPQTLSRVGASPAETAAVPGPFLTKEPVNPETLPRTDVRILLVNQRLYVEADETNRTHTVPNLTVSSPDDVDAVETGTRRVYDEWTRAIQAVRPDVVVSLQGIAPAIRRRLVADGVTVVQRAKPESVFQALAASTGATVVSSLDELDASHLGTASRLECHTYNDLPYVFVHGTAQQVYSLVVRGWAWSWVELVETVLRSLFRVGRTASESGRFVPGGGKAEATLAAAVRDEATGVSDRSQLAMEGYAGALDRTVRTLWQNIGVSGDVALATLSSGDSPDASGWFDGTRPVDLLAVKASALGKATNATLTLLNVDAILDAS